MSATLFDVVKVHLNTLGCDLRKVDDGYDVIDLHDGRLIMTFVNLAHFAEVNRIGLSGDLKRAGTQSDRDDRVKRDLI